MVAYTYHLISQEADASPGYIAFASKKANRASVVAEASLHQCKFSHRLICGKYFEFQKGHKITWLMVPVAKPDDSGPT